LLVYPLEVLLLGILQNVINKFDVLPKLIGDAALELGSVIEHYHVEVRFLALDESLELWEILRVNVFC